MRRTTRALISAGLLPLLSLTVGTRVLDDARRYRDAPCAREAACSPAELPRWVDSPFVVGVVVPTVRFSSGPIETVRRTGPHAAPHTHLDAGHPVSHALASMRASASRTRSRTSDIPRSGAVCCVAATPIRAPPTLA